MMKPIPVESGYFTVLPNRRANARGEVVWAMNELSPMILGPVLHGQPGLEPAENLENFHQFNKVFESEYDEATGKVYAVWHKRRDSGYADRTPHRHKLGATKAAHMKNAGIKAGGNVNKCLFSIFITPEGEERRFDYVASRIFYCTFYERLACKTSAMNKLVDALYVHHQGILIAGYDARNLDDDEITHETIQQWYHDPSWPFGHEMVLHAILYHWNDPDELPWRKEAETRVRSLTTAEDSLQTRLGIHPPFRHIHSEQTSSLLMINLFNVLSVNILETRSPILFQALMPSNGTG